MSKQFLPTNFLVVVLAVGIVFAIVAAVVFVVVKVIVGHFGELSTGPIFFIFFSKSGMDKTNLCPI